MPASMITAWVALSPNVTGSRIEMPDSGPMPGSTPTSVPTRQPRNAYQTLSSCNATANPFSRLCRVASTILPLVAERPGDERRLEHVDERQIGEADHADAVERGVEQRTPLDRHEQGEHHQHHGGEEAERLEEIDRDRGERRHGGRVLGVAPLDLDERPAFSGPRDQHDAERDGELGDDFR